MALEQNSPKFGSLKISVRHYEKMKRMPLALQKNIIEQNFQLLTLPPKFGFLVF